MARFKAGVFVSLGAGARRFPEVDSWNYAPRIKVPILMQNGHDDWLFPVEISQIPMFRALGTAGNDKKHVVYQGGHVDFINRMDVIKEALSWLDRYLGPVAVKQ